jgi:hypothetical protein
MNISNKEIREIKELYKTAEQAREQAKEKIRNLQERIKKGGKSDNPIQDFVILHCSSVSPEYQKVLKDLEDKLEGKEGKEILIAKEIMYEERDKIFLEGSGFEQGKEIMAPPKHYSEELELKIGIISGDSGFNVKDGEMVIPTQGNRHLESKHKYPKYSDSDLGKFQDVKWEEISGEIKIQKGDLNYLIAIKAESYTPISSLIAEPKILIGKEVEEYFTTCENIDDAYCKAMDLLQNKINSKDK